jgi:hypothetical protein
MLLAKMPKRSGYLYPDLLLTRLVSLDFRRRLASSLLDICSEQDTSLLTPSLDSKRSLTRLLALDPEQHRRQDTALLLTRLLDPFLDLKQSRGLGLNLSLTRQLALYSEQSRCPDVLLGPCLDLRLSGCVDRILSQSRLFPCRLDCMLLLELE